MSGGHRRRFTVNDNTIATTSSTSDAKFYIKTVDHSNPFRGWFAVAWEIDDWAHRRISVRLHRVLFGRLCDALDRRLAS